MGWLRLVGSLKSQVSFAKEPYKRDDILQKRRIILRSLRIVATPYQSGDSWQKKKLSGTWISQWTFYIQSIEDRVALNLEIILKKIQRTRILPMGFTISTK